MRRILAMCALCATITAAPLQPARPQDDSFSTLLTIVLRPDQTRTLEDIETHLRQTGFYRRFPPEGVELVSWTAVMGLGQIVILRVPPSRLREVNRILQETVWGSYGTEFYPSYDFRMTAEQLRQRAH